MDPLKYCSLVDATMIWGCKKEMKLLYEKERQTIGCGIKGGERYGKRERVRSLLL